MLLILQPIIAFFLYLPRYKSSYYSDHLILTVYTHASIFSLLLIYYLPIFLFGYPSDNNLVDGMTVIYFLGMMAFIIMSLKRYYRLSSLRTIMLMFYVATVYGISFVGIFVLNLIVSFLLF